MLEKLIDALLFRSKKVSTPLATAAKKPAAKKPAAKKPAAKKK